MSFLRSAGRSSGVAPDAANAANAANPAPPAKPADLAAQAMAGADIKLVIDTVANLAPLSETAVRIMGLVEDSSSTMKELAAVVEADPALAARVLKVANSAFFGVVQEVRSLDRAIVLIGRNGVRNIAVAARIAQLVQKVESSLSSFARDLWTHSIATGACSKLMCRQLTVCPPDEAFLAGLIHDIGIMVEMQAIGAKLSRVLGELAAGKDGERQSMLEIERRICGADHQVFGLALCESWRLPIAFQHVCGWHHNPMESPGSEELCCVVCVAERLAAECDFGFRGELADHSISDSAMARLKLEPATIQAIKAALPGAVEEVQVML